MLGILNSGDKVFDRPDSHAKTHTGVWELLPEVLSRLDSQNREFIMEEIKMGRVVGKTILSDTQVGDEIFYAQRPNRKGLTRFVKNKNPKDCDTVVVILGKKDHGYMLISSWIGFKTPVEPWDPKADQKAIDFWNSHALIAGCEEIIPGTETEICPW
ncbi:MAG: hypothetical protein WC011_00520 [Candidatus Paceibacterota bacterium]